MVFADLFDMQSSLVSAFITAALTHSCLKQPKLPHYFGEISLIHAMVGNYLKESCSLTHYLQIPLKFLTN